MSPERKIIINERGHLVLSGCDATELVEAYGTPLYVLDEQAVRNTCRAYVETLERQYPQGRVLYAGKALLTKAVCRIVHDEGLGLDVVSGGELYTALAADFPPHLIYFHGNNKSEAELIEALDAGVGHIVVDGAEELRLLAELARQREVRANVLLRITPGVEAHTHSYIQTGQIDSKFGFPLVHDVAMEGARLAANLPGIRLVGFHCHIGSQIVDLQSYAAAVRRMVEFTARVRNELGVTTEQLNIGGGLGIAYNKEDEPPTIERLVRQVAQTVRAECDARDVPLPMLLLEPGRSIIGPAGTTLYSIGFVKATPGLKTYAAVDGGMGDNPRVALYQARHEALLANRAGEEPRDVVTIAGKYCETGDILLHDIKLPTPARGDVLAVFDTGAYNFSMASNYNRMPRAAMVLVANGRHELIVRRETYDDLISRDVVPSRLAPANVEEVPC